MKDTVKIEDKIRIYMIVGIPYDFIRSFDVPCSTLCWFPFFEEAENFVFNNKSDPVEKGYNKNDISENGYMKWIVIEEIESGFPANMSFRSWYEWDGDKYNKIDAPKELKIINSYSTR
jgi:hypothetical protein